ncbi:MAG: family 16 glycosylhydrolase [Clostridia bacterium]|nr:family 16 glycosylhydrolase [Clostridia bacterium]
MQNLFKISSLFIALIMLLSCVGCANNTDLPIRTPLVDETDYSDTDHLFDYKKVSWNGPEGYVIIVPKGGEAAQKTAELLKNYYLELGVELEIKDDSISETEKEILIGKTTRKQSSTLKENEMKVSLKGEKLVFEGGHDVTVDSAVKKFIRLSPQINEAYTFSLSTDFKSTLSGNLANYQYVWGDEFEGIGLDPEKWHTAVNMKGSKQVELSRDKSVIDVNDGRLKLHAIHCFNNNRANTKYRVPYSVVTQKTMNYIYGYAEVRSRIPYKAGCWPSFWTRSTDYLQGSRNYDYMVEVDIYEIFRTTHAYATLHKWYKTGGSTNTANGYVATNPNRHVFEYTPSLTFEYHTYGYEWTPDEIKMSVDGKVFCTFDLNKSFDKNTDQSGFHDPQYFIFNNHIFHPEISTACVSITAANDSLPAAHYVDYIRLYQKSGVGKVYTEKQEVAQ